MCKRPCFWNTIICSISSACSKMKCLKISSINVWHFNSNTNITMLRQALEYSLRRSALEISSYHIFAVIISNIFWWWKYEVMAIDFWKISNKFLVLSMWNNKRIILYPKFYILTSWFCIFLIMFSNLWYIYPHIIYFDSYWNISTDFILLLPKHPQ